MCASWVGGTRNLYSDSLYGFLAFLLYAQWGSDKNKPEGMAHDAMMVNEAEL